MHHGVRGACILSSVVRAPQQKRQQQQQHILESRRTCLFLIFVLDTFLRVLYNNIHHNVNQRSKLHTYIAEVLVLHTPVEVRFSMTCRFYMSKANEGMYIYRRSCRSLSLMLSCLTVSSICVVYSRGNRTPESEKKQTSVYLIKWKMKRKNLYTYQVRIYPVSYTHLTLPTTPYV